MDSDDCEAENALTIRRANEWNEWFFMNDSSASDSNSVSGSYFHCSNTDATASVVPAQKQSTQEL